MRVTAVSARVCSTPHSRVTCQTRVIRAVRTASRFFLGASLAVCLGYDVSTAGNIHEVKYANQADVKVFRVKYENQADLCVYVAEYANQAEGKDEIWHYVEYANQADAKIFFVEYENQSDLKVYFVKYQNQAKWRKSNRFRGIFK
jgi:hypothetical protein